MNILNIDGAICTAQCTYVVARVYTARTYIQWRLLPYLARKLCLLCLQCLLHLEHLAPLLQQPRCRRRIFQRMPTGWAARAHHRWTPLQARCNSPDVAVFLCQHCRLCRACTCKYTPRYHVFAAGCHSPRCGAGESTVLYWCTCLVNADSLRLLRIKSEL
jgi:hypothetical protein